MPLHKTMEETFQRKEKGNIYVLSCSGTIGLWLRRTLVWLDWLCRLLKIY